MSPTSAPSWQVIECDGKTVRSNRRDSVRQRCSTGRRCRDSPLQHDVHSWVCGGPSDDQPARHRGDQSTSQRQAETVEVVGRRVREPRSFVGDRDRQRLGVSVVFDEDLICSMFERIVHEHVERLSQDGPIAMNERAVVRR